MKRRIAALAAALLLLAGCGVPEETAAAETPRILTPSPAPETPAPAPTPVPVPEPTAEPTPESTPEPESEELILARQVMARMDLRQLVGQLFIVEADDLTGQYGTTSAGADVIHYLNEYPVGGVILMDQNLSDPGQAAALISNLQAFSVPDLFISVDEEGGLVSRAADNLGTRAFAPMFEYREEGPETAYENARAIGEDLSALGFNLDFAPVADVWTNPENTVIGRRAYSDDFDEAGVLVAAAVRGFHDGGVLCTLKHFPGHGDTTADTHTGTAVTERTLEEMRAGEFLPFAAGIEAGADLVMLAHVTAPALDGEIASLSPEVVRILRGELGFTGVIVTDALRMGAVTEAYASDEAAVRALEAGADLLLLPEDPELAVRGVEAAVEEGRLSRERIEESVLRILTLKASIGILH